MSMAIEKILVLKQCSEEGRPVNELKSSLEILTKQKFQTDKLNKILKELQSKGLVYCDEDGWWLTTLEGEKKLSVLLKDKNILQELRRLTSIKLTETELKVLRRCSISVPKYLKYLASELKMPSDVVKAALKKLKQEYLVLFNKEGWWLSGNGKDCIDGARMIKVEKA